MHLSVNVSYRFKNVVMVCDTTLKSAETGSTFRIKGPKLVFVKGLMGMKRNKFIFWDQDFHFWESRTFLSENKSILVMCLEKIPCKS